MDADIKYFQFIHPFTCMVAGPTSCGKTVFVNNLIKNSELLLSNIDKLKVTWAYGQWQKSYEDTEGIDYFEGLPSEEYLQDSKTNLLIIDDLMTELGNDKKLANLFTKGSHHMNISIIFIVQNIFHQAKYMRNVSLNCHYFILMKNPRDKSQIYSLARQLYPKNSYILIEAYMDATKEPYSYLKIDFKPSTPDKYRLQTDIFPNPYFRPIIYQQK